MSHTASIERQPLFGFDFVADANYDGILKALKEGHWRQQNSLPLMITPNVDQVVKFHRKGNRALYEELKNASFILPDGQPLVAISKWKKQPRLQARLTGSDFFPLVWKMLQKQQSKVAFVLSNEAIAQSLQTECPNCATFVPPFFDVNDQKAFDEVVHATVAMIRNAKAEHLFLGLGFPKQERLFLAVHKALGNETPFTYLLGASMEFYTGHKNRAPRFFQKIGMEFLHRLLTEPRRMAKRYLIDDVAILPLAWRELRGKSTFPSKP